MNRSKTEMMVARLMANAANLRYGIVSVSVKLHCGKVVEVSYSTTEKTNEKETLENNGE
jgi:ribosomal protein S3